MTETIEKPKYVHPTEEELAMIPGGCPSGIAMSIFLAQKPQVNTVWSEHRLCYISATVVYDMNNIGKTFYEMHAGGEVTEYAEAKVLDRAMPFWWEKRAEFFKAGAKIPEVTVENEEDV